MTTVSIASPVDSKHWKNFSYPNDLVHVATNSQMTYYLATQNLYILHPYRRESIRKYDLSFQLTYHTLAFAFQTISAEGHICSTQYVKNTTNSCTRPTYFKYTNFSTTYHRSAHSKDLSSRRQSENTKRYTENTPYRRKIEMSNAPRCSSSRIRCIQTAHIAFRTCFGNSCGQNGKNTIDRNTRERQANKTQAKHFSSEKVIASQKACPYQIACAARLPKLSSLAAAVSP